MKTVRDQQRLIQVQGERLGALEERNAAGRLEQAAADAQKDRLKVLRKELVRAIVVWSVTYAPTGE
jgi:hypothetical protein